MKRFFALILCLALCLSLLPVGFAEDIEIVEETPAADSSINVLETTISADEEEIEGVDADLARVEFICDPVDATVIVYDPDILDENGSSVVIEPEEDGSYLLAPGEYCFSAKHIGYDRIERAEFIVEEDKVIDLTLIANYRFLQEQNGDSPQYSDAHPLPNMTGDQAVDTANIAKSQEGYTMSGGTVYGAWWNGVTNWGVDYTYSGWCAMFACWCAYQAGAGLNVAYNKNGANPGLLLDWQKSYATSDTNCSTSPRAGDFIYFAGSDGVAAHVAIVTSYDSSAKRVYFVGGNQGEPSAVRASSVSWTKGAYWGTQTVMGYGRPNYSTSGTHVHDKGTYMYYEEAHPHRKCYKCSVCGTIWADPNSYTLLAGCDDCRPEKPEFIGLEGTHSADDPVYFYWNETARTTHYNIWVYKENDYGEYEAVDHSFYVESGYSLTLEPGYYKAVLQAYNSELWESDHSDWVYTESDPTYFTVESSKGYTLDINGLLDGETAGWIGNYGTVDVYINGELVADDVDDYYVWHPEGTYYFITDVKVFDGKTFNGYADGSASYYGYLYEDTEVILSYSSLYSLDLNGLLDGEWAYWIKDYGTVDIYVNGELVADDADDFFQYYPAGTYYYITDISANIGKEYNGFAYGSAEFYGYLYEDTEVILSYSTMQSYYVTIYPNGGYFRDSGSSAPIQVLRTVGEELDLLGNEYLMRRPGYLYMGLSISPTEIDYNGNDYFGLCYDPDEIVPYSLYGAWEKIDDRIITYDANGGTGAPAPQTKVYDEDITLSSVRPTRASSSAGSYTITLNANGGSVSPTSLSAARTTHYTFSTWNTARDGSGIKYDPETIYSGNDNLTLYAQWFSITLTSSVMLPTPSRDGYSFRGWASSSTASSGFFDSYMPDGNETLYATWVKTETPPDETLFLSDSDITLPVFSNVCLELRNGKGNIVTASWFSSDENVATVDENGLVTANKYGKCTIYAVAGGKGYACEVQTLFWDVADPSVYYFKHVYWAAENGITKGYNLEYFDPQGTCTREQMMTFLWRMAGKPEPKTTTSKFSDVEKGAYYYKAVLWGVEKGITNGYSSGEYAGKFGVGLPCTREQAMTFLWRLAGKPNPKSTTNKFADVKSSDYFYKAVLWASENGIANGYSSGEYAGKYGVGLACLREHMVTFLSRYYSKFMP